MNQPSERCVWMRVGQAPCDPAQDHALACSYCREAWALVVPAEDVARAMLRLVGSEPLDEQRRRNV